MEQSILNQISMHRCISPHGWWGKCFQSFFSLWVHKSIIGTGWIGLSKRNQRHRKNSKTLKIFWRLINLIEGERICTQAGVERKGKSQSHSLFSTDSHVGGQSHDLEITTWAQTNKSPLLDQLSHPDASRNQQRF